MRKVTKENNLKVLCPDIAAEWHPTKNGSLTPELVVPGSGRRVWWMCVNGHEWQTDIFSRTHGSGCSYCLGMHATLDYNLAVINPELAAQWHPRKNGSLKPEHVTPGSEKLVWWRCEEGHVWKSTVYNRRYHHCPECARIKSRNKKKFLSFAEAHPELVRKWHPTKNGNLTPHDVTPGTHQVVWWQCDWGHEWQRDVKAISGGNGCPYCSGHRPSKENNLLAVNPEICKEWHPTKNGSLTPDQVTPNSEKFVWWLCEKGHSYETMVINRNKGGQCPLCLGRKNKTHEISPSLLKEWHYKKNGKLTPQNYVVGSDVKIWWKCSKGHSYEATVMERKYGKKCPFCRSNRPNGYQNLTITNPNIIKEWHPTKNGSLTPDKVSRGSERRVWWLCEKGHEWESMVYSRRNDNPCPYCSGKLASKEYNFKTACPEVAKEWHPTKNGDLTPDQLTPGSDRIVWWRCVKGHEWQISVYLRRKGQKCPTCIIEKRKQKKLEKEQKIIKIKTPNLLSVDPELAREWHPTKNGDYTPDKVYPNSQKHVWWICKNNHEWKASVSSRRKTRKCLYCAQKLPSREFNFKTVHPHLVAEWHTAKNGELSPESFLPKSSKKVWWKCKKGHEWYTAIYLRSKGHNCPKCSRRGPGVKRTDP